MERESSGEGANEDGDNGSTIPKRRRRKGKRYERGVQIQQSYLEGSLKLDLSSLDSLVVSSLEDSVLISSRR